MEACIVNVYAQNINKLTQSLSAITFIRDKKNKINLYKKVDTKANIEKNNNICTNSNLNNTLFRIIEKDGIKKYHIKLKDKEINVNINDFSFSKERVLNINFIDSIGFSYKTIKENYISIQKIDKEGYLNEILKSFDSNIESFKIIDDKAQCKVNGEYLETIELGDGVNHLVSIVSSLYNSKDGYLFIDEIENGFHYTFLDRLWEIILTISKEQNVQVFATTHSKECIESYAKVSKELEEKKKIDKDDISFIELGKNKENKLDSIIYNYEMIQSEIKQNHEIRGW